MDFGNEIVGGLDNVFRGTSFEKKIDPFSGASDVLNTGIDFLIWFESDVLIWVWSDALTDYPKTKRKNFAVFSQLSRSIFLSSSELA
jgi:hypothetical protein